MIAAPAHIFEAKVRSDLEAKLERLARTWAAQQSEGPGVIEVPIGSSPWGVTLRADVKRAEDGGAVAKAVLQELARWYAAQAKAARHE